jgi:hypothetical protein
MNHHWYKPRFWLWWWRYNVRPAAKAAVGTVLLALICVGGFLAAISLGDTRTETVLVRAVTVTRTEIVNGKPRIIKEVRTTALPAKTRLVTVRHNGRAVLVTAPAETITNVSTTTLPGHETVVTRVKNHTVVRTVPRDRLRTVTLPGITLPGTTIQGPERVVTLPERVVTARGETVTAPGETVVRTVTDAVTLPAKTTTETVTETEPLLVVTVTKTVTNEVTVTQEVTVTETKP